MSFGIFKEITFPMQCMALPPTRATLVSSSTHANIELQLPRKQSFMSRGFCNTVFFLFFCNLYRTANSKQLDTFDGWGILYSEPQLCIRLYTGCNWMNQSQKHLLQIYFQRSRYWKKSSFSSPIVTGETKFFNQDSDPFGTLWVINPNLSLHNNWNGRISEVICK